MRVVEEFGTKVTAFVDRGPERYSLVAVVVGLVGALLVWVAVIVTDRWRRA